MEGGITICQLPCPIVPIRSTWRQRSYLAFVTHNSLRTADLPALIKSVHAGLVKIANGETIRTQPTRADGGGSDPQVGHTGLPHLSGRRPQVQISAAASVGARNDAGTIPGEVEVARRLSDVAPNYAAKRSALAKEIGLGQFRKNGGAMKRKPR